MKLIALQGRLNLGTEEAPDFPVKCPSAVRPAAAVTNRAACFRGYCKPRQGRVRWPGTVPPMSQRLLTATRVQDQTVEQPGIGICFLMRFLPAMLPIFRHRRHKGAVGAW